MKRRAGKFVVYLLLLGCGAIVNVAVAWGFARWPVTARQLTRIGLSGVNSPCWLIQQSESVTNRIIGFSVMRATPLSDYRQKSGISVLTSVPDELSSPPDFKVGSLDSGMDLASGWPMLSMDRQVRGYFVSEGNQPRLETTHTLIVGTYDDGRALPLRPLWPGFVINTIFYAGVLWMVFAFPGMVRRRRRIKRGLCPACAYPVGSSPVCTECGKAVSLKSVEQP